MGKHGRVSPCPFTARRTKEHHEMAPSARTRPVATSTARAYHVAPPKPRLTSSGGCQEPPEACGSSANAPKSRTGESAMAADGASKKRTPFARGAGTGTPAALDGTAAA